MRRTFVTAALVAVALTSWPSVAASQEGDQPTSTTEAPTTTVAPTTVPPTTEAPPTTVADAPPTTVEPTESTTTTTTVLPAASAPPALSGENITEGTLGIDVAWLDDTLRGCNATIPLGGGQMNRFDDFEGYLGLVYGQAPSPTGNTAVLMVELGVVPYGIGVLSSTDNGCNLDAIGVGEVVRGTSFLSVRGVGIGITPVSSRIEPIGTFDLVANVAASRGPAYFDLPSMAEFVSRPNRFIPPPPTTTPPPDAPVDPPVEEPAAPDAAGT